MKKIISVFLLMLLPSSWQIFAWGFFAHKKINHLAVYTLPTGMFGFYKEHIDFLTEHAVDPDKRRYAVGDEAARHYIDLDHYGENPFDIFPLSWKQAVDKFSEDTLLAYGIVPWWVLVMHGRLTDAFRAKNANAILRLSADIGHYIADAHVPLHCTKNYNGQLTNQHGIHAFWESRLPELFHFDYDFFTGKAQVFENPYREIWRVVYQSYMAKDSVLSFESELNQQISADRKYVYEQRGAATLRTYSREYSEAYHNMLAGQVERRMRESILCIGSFWATAWQAAGQPDLSNLKLNLTEEEKKQLEEEDRMWRTGKVKNDKGHTDH